MHETMGHNDRGTAFGDERACASTAKIASRAPCAVHCGSSSGGHAVTVLVCNHDRSYAEALPAQIALRGYSVTQVSSRAQAEDYCAANNVHLLVTIAGENQALDLRWMLALLERTPTLVALVVSAVSIPSLDGSHVRLRVLTGASAIDAALDAVCALSVGRHLQVADLHAGGDLAVYRASYAARVAEHVRLLSETIARAADGAAPLDVVRFLAHRMRGTAGSHGYAGLATRAGEIEDRIQALFARQRVESDDWRALRYAAQGLETALPRQSLPVSALSMMPPADGILVVSSAGEFVFRVRSEALGYGVDVVDVPVHDLSLGRSGKHIIGAIVDENCDDMARPDAIQIATDLRLSTGVAALPVVVVTSEHQLRQRLRIAEMAGVLIVSEDSLEEEFSALLGFMRGGRAQQDFRVLIVDDDPDFIAAAEPILARMNVEVLALSSATDLLATMDEWVPDLLLLDVVMPDISGLEACRALRKSIRWQAIPIVLVTGRVDDASRLSAYRAGASDFVSKPLVAEELEARVGVRLEQIRLSRDYSERDSLTSLWNRRRFLAATERVQARATATGRPLALGMIDLDHFKKINDRYGHGLGDQVLARFGRLLSTRLREGQHACRWGGEEFLFLAEDTTAATMQRLLGRLLALFCSDPFQTDEDREPFYCSFSAGVAELVTDGASFKDLLTAADRRLYRAKAMGRSRVISSDDTAKEPV